jgi:peroxiredoxin
MKVLLRTSSILFTARFNCFEPERHTPSAIRLMQLTLLVATIFTTALLLLVSCAPVLSTSSSSFVPATSSSATVPATKSSGTGIIACGEPAPDFTLPDLYGKKVTLGDFRGKPVMLAFLNSGGQPCREQMPYMQALLDEPSSIAPDLVILAIDVNEPTFKISEFFAATKYTFPVLLDTDGKIAFTYRITSLATTYFIDRQGIIRDYRHGAFHDREAILENIVNMLSLNPTSVVITLGPTWEPPPTSFTPPTPTITRPSALTPASEGSVTLEAAGTLLLREDGSPASVFQTPYFGVTLEPGIQPKPVYVNIIISGDNLMGTPSEEPVVKVIWRYDTRYLIDDSAWVFQTGSWAKITWTPTSYRHEMIATAQGSFRIIFENHDEARSHTVSWTVYQW